MQFCKYYDILFVICPKYLTVQFYKIFMPHAENLLLIDAEFD